MTLNWSCRPLTAGRGIKTKSRFLVWPPFTFLLWNNGSTAFPSVLESWDVSILIQEDQRWLNELGQGDLTPWKDRSQKQAGVSTSYYPVIPGIGSSELSKSDPERERCMTDNTWVDTFHARCNWDPWKVVDLWIASKAPTINLLQGIESTDSFRQGPFTPVRTGPLWPMESNFGFFLFGTNSKHSSKYCSHSNVWVGVFKYFFSYSDKTEIWGVLKLETLVLVLVLVDKSTEWYFLKIHYNCCFPTITQNQDQSFNENV